MNNVNHSTVSQYPCMNFKIHITDDIHNLISFLVDKKIPFSMTSEKIECLTPESNTNDSGKVNILGNESKKSNLIAKLDFVYQKYIVDKIESTPPKINEIAAEIGISPSNFKALFAEKYKMTFYQLYMDKRMEYAAALLEKNYKCNQVSEMVGYGEKSSIKFNKMFQKHFGITPKKYQMSNR